MMEKDIKLLAKQLGISKILYRQFESDLVKCCNNVPIPPPRGYSECKLVKYKMCQKLLGDKICGENICEIERLVSKYKDMREWKFTKKWDLVKNIGWFLITESGYGEASEDINEYYSCLCNVDNEYNGKAELRIQLWWDMKNSITGIWTKTYTTDIDGDKVSFNDIETSVEFLYETERSSSPESSMHSEKFRMFLLGQLKKLIKLHRRYDYDCFFPD